MKLILFLLLSISIYAPAFSNAAQSPKDCSFLLSNLDKGAEALGSDVLSDLDDETKPFEVKSKAWTDNNKTFRLKVLKDFEIANLVAAPGHRFLRKPEQIAGLVKYIKENNGGDFRHDHLIFNILTNADHDIKEVDIWNAHHRALAYMNSGYETIGQLDPDNIDVLVDGYDTEKRMWRHHLSAAGIDVDQIQDWYPVPPDGETRVGTVAVLGNLSNFVLGSRNTIRQLHFNTFTHKQPRIGVYFGAFDPIHEGHIAVAEAAIKEFNLDEVIFVPNVNEPAKPNITNFKLRVQMIRERIKSNPLVEVYVGDSSKIVDRFGRDPLIERIGQIFGSKQLFQIIGSDSFEKNLREGNITPKANRKFIVFGRQGDDLSKLNLPDDIKDIVLFAKAKDELGLSSTKIRNEIKNGLPTNEKEIHPSVVEAIKKLELYR